MEPQGVWSRLVASCLLGHKWHDKPWTTPRMGVCGPSTSIRQCRGAKSIGVSCRNEGDTESHGCQAVWSREDAEEQGRGNHTGVVQWPASGGSESSHTNHGAKVCHRTLQSSTIRIAAPR